MKKLPIYLAIILAVQLLHTNICNAQNATLNLKPAPANVVIDGSLSEWGDSLSYYNSETEINYTLANDKDNLYLVLKTKDPVEQAKILHSGITLGIDTKGKKKAAYSVTFPVQDNEGKLSGNSNAAQEKKLEVVLTRLRKIKAEGFKDVDYDLITLENTYGFKIALNFDPKGFLVYEESIPLALFHADDLKKNEWAFNITINGAQKKDDADDQAKNSPMGGGKGRRGGGGGGGGFSGGGGRGNHNKATTDDDDNDSDGASAKSIAFSGKFYLNQH
jgi:uncharacterized membrane protein YgcG